jgi:SAM-dependent methyltransferase
MSTEFDHAYGTDMAPWIIGEPQPAVVALADQGWIRGAVLDIGCGTGEHAIHFARLGYSIQGIDFSAIAIERARRNAAKQQVLVSFEVADALSLPDEARYDTIIDSALFHYFDATDRVKYVQSLGRACRPQALVHVLAVSEPGEGWPNVSDTMIRDAFGAGWMIEDLRPSQFRVAEGDYGERVDLSAWQARIRRI